VNSLNSSIKVLKELMEISGDDDVLIKTIEKLTQYKIEALKKDLREIKRKLLKFERKYKMKSSDFIKKFESGQLGDDADFMEWASLWDMAERVESRLQKIKGA
jgi:hypothetical protein